MFYIQGKDRSQIVLFSKLLDQIIDSEHEVRLIDLFADHIEVNKERNI